MKSVTKSITFATLLLASSAGFSNSTAPALELENENLDSLISNLKLLERVSMQDGQQEDFKDLVHDLQEEVLEKILNLGVEEVETIAMDRCEFER